MASKCYFASDAAVFVNPTTFAVRIKVLKRGAGGAKRGRGVGVGEGTTPFIGHNIASLCAAA